MTEACSLPTPAQLQYGEIQTRIELALRRKVDAAIRGAAEQALAEMRAAGLEARPPSADYFAAKVHQSLYCTLCKADPRTFAGGKPEIALAIIRNSQNIAKHCWGADIEPHPRT
jgi:hypothetical protein